MRRACSGSFCRVRTVSLCRKALQLFGQMLHPDFAVAAYDDGVLHAAFKLPHVSRPGIGQEKPLHCRRKASCLSILLGKFPQEILCQEQYVFAPLPQGGMTMVKVLRRKYKSSRNFPSRTICFRLRFVAAITRTSTSASCRSRFSVFPPTAGPAAIWPA